MEKKQRIMSKTMADRISNLPANLIDQILSYLPYGDAVRTSVLSRNWRNKWMSIPQLTFDAEMSESINLDSDLDIESIIYRALLLHRGPLRRFKLAYPHYLARHAVDTWLQFLLNTHIQVLWLDDPVDSFVLPHHFFGFDRLTQLRLSCVSFTTPPGFTGFTKLVSLHLECIQTESGDLTRLLSKCPSVESLHLWYCNIPGKVHVDAPSLKYINIRDWFCPIFVNAMGIERLSVEFDNLDMTVSGFSESTVAEPNLISAFGYLPCVKKLKFNNRVLQYLARFGIPENPSKLKSLAVIKISSAQFGMTDFVNSAICLLKSSCNLQRLEINVIGNLEHNKESVPTVVQYLKKQQELEPLLPCLKTVEICGMSGTESEMEFVRLILLWAIVLEKLEFKRSSCNGPLSEKGFKMIKELAGFRRASSHAEVVCKE